MPVYRAKKPVRVIPKVLKIPQDSQAYAAAKSARNPIEQSTLRSHAQVKGEGNKRYWNIHGGWGFRSTPLITINSRMGINPKWWVDRVMLRRAWKRTSQKPLIVVEWGCGTGAAAKDLQAIGEKYNVKVVGYSDVSYKEWEEARKKVDIIWTPKEQLPRFFRKTKIGMIYSHLGLMHLSPEELFEHLTHLGKSLEKNAILITDLGGEVRESPTERISAIRSAGFRMVARGADGAVFVYHPKRTSF